MYDAYLFIGEHVFVYLFDRLLSLMQINLIFDPLVPFLKRHG